MNRKYIVKLFACIPPPLFGGVTVYSKRLALGLCKHGIPSGAFYSRELVGVPQEYSYLFDRMIKHAHSIYVLPELIKLYKICQPYQLIHTHLSLKTVFCMWFIHKMQKKPLVITIHNEMIDQEMAGLNAIDRFCIKSLFRDNSVQIICVNDKAKNLLKERFHIIANSIKVIPAYIKPIELGIASDYLSKELVRFIDTHPRLIVFYAESFAYNNGVEIYGTKDCIDAFVAVHSEIQDLSLVFCMPNVNDETKLLRLKQIITENKLDDYVYWQTDALTEMWPVLKKASVYLRPTSTDGDSVLLREALGMGIPSLASDIVKRPNECALYKYGDTADLIRCLKHLVLSPTIQTPSNKDFFNDILDIYKSFLGTNIVIHE